jgi:hypothetical protein
MLHSERRSNFIDQRKRLLYNNGDFVSLGDVVKYNEKLGRIVNYDRQTVNILLNDGKEASNVPIENVKKADIVDQLIDGTPWIRKKK